MTKRIITIKLTRVEAEGLMNVGNRGVADLIDAINGHEDDLENVDLDGAEVALNKLGVAMAEAWPDKPT